MIKLVYHKPGTAPASLEVEGSGESLPPVIGMIRYDASSYEEITCRDAAEAIRSIDPSKRNWINVDGLHDTETIRQLASHFGLSPCRSRTSSRPSVPRPKSWTGIFSSPR